VQKHTGISATTKKIEPVLQGDFEKSLEKMGYVLRRTTYT